MSIDDSFEPGITQTGPKGQLAHPETIKHSKRLEKKLYKVGDKAWSLIGNGLSNQSFVEGPKGLICIDTGESNQEMKFALAEVRKQTQAPIAGCIYTHFHYVGGTQTLIEENKNLPIWGHSGIQANLNRFGGEIAPRVTRGLAHQFATSMPQEGPDGVVNLGLGNFFRNPEHAPFTNGYIPPKNTFDEPTKTKIAGLKVEFYPAPSDATDSITVWFPELKLAINNLLWPVLFNVFAIRGEEYRDPRILMKGLDQLAELGARNLIGAHGPPILGETEIKKCIINYRDTLQFLWDQTVRCANLGLTLNETIATIKLPKHFKKHYTTQQLYGVVEHHVRQIYTGLFGWFDEDEANLFPVPSPERSKRLIEGFGGKNKVREIIDNSLKEEDFRWAIELSSWLVRSELNNQGTADAGEPEDRKRLATSLRGVAYSTSAANIRNWCITRALELDESLNLSRFRRHRFNKKDLSRRSPADSLSLLRVLLIPEKADGLDLTIKINFNKVENVFYSLRNSVAVVCQETKPNLSISVNEDCWFDILSGKKTLSEALDEKAIETDQEEEVKKFFTCFDHKTLNS